MPEIGNWVFGKCQHKKNEERLPEKEFEDSQARKEKAAHMFESSRVLGAHGLNKNNKFFTEVWEKATNKDIRLHEMTEADLKKFKWELQDREAWINEGFEGGGSAFKVLEANLKRIPGGSDLYKAVARISAYHREHTTVNNNRISIINEHVTKIANTLGVDLRTLEKLERKVAGARDKIEENNALNEIKDFLGAFNSESKRTDAGDLYLSVRDVLENTPLKELRRSNGEKWDQASMESFEIIRNSWYDMRKDLVRVLKNALRTEKRIVSQTDRMERGRRRLTEYLDRIDQYISVLEFQETSNPKGRKYDIDGKEAHEFGLSGNKHWDLNTNLGYMPHYVLTMVKDLQKFNDFAMNTTESRTAFEVFSDQVRLWEGSNGVLNRVKGRQSINQEYYSRNPFLFLNKYLHEVAAYNRSNSLKEATQGVMNMFIDAKRQAKTLGDKDAVNKFVDQASEVIEHIVDSTMGTGVNEYSFTDKAARFMTGLAFVRTMGFNGRSAIRNSGQRLLEHIKLGLFARSRAEDYLTDTNLKTIMTHEATKHGIMWSRDSKFLKKLQSAYEKGGEAGTKGTIEERPLLPGLREVVDPKTGKKTIEMYDESMSDKLLNTLEGIAQKGSVLHTMVENMNRNGTFRVAFATAHQNLSKQPKWYIESMMERDNTTRQQRNQFIANESGKLAYGVVSEIHFEYGKVFKPKVFQEGGGAVLGQFQHYRFSLANLQYETFKRGFRDIWSGDAGWSNDGARTMYQTFLAYSTVGALTNIMGVGFGNLLSNDNYEFVKNQVLFFSAERDNEGNLTEEGLKQAEKATYGAGSWSHLGPSVGTIVELGELMHWWDVDMNSYMPLLNSGSDRVDDLEDEDRNYKLMRLANIQGARFWHHTRPALFNLHLGKAFYIETGLYTDYETQQNSKQFWQWARDITGIPTTGRKNAPLTRKVRQKSPMKGVKPWNP